MVDVREAEIKSNTVVSVEKKCCIKNIIQN